MAVPLLGMAVFAGGSAIDKLGEARAADELNLLVNLSVNMGNLVHEAQKERGATALFMASDGEEFQSELPAQHAVTDAAGANLLTFLAEHELPEGIRNGLTPALAGLSGLDAQRQGALALTAESGPTISYYTAMNGNFLRVIASVATASSNAELRGDSTAYLSFLQAKERTGIERAQLSAVFATDEFAPGQLAHVVSLIAAQDAYLHLFEQIAEPGVLSYYEQTQADPAVAETARLEAIAIANGDSGFGIDSGVWFDTISARINLLKDVEDFQADSILAKSSGTADAATRAFVTSLVLALGLISVTIAFGSWTIVGLIRQLRLSSTSLDDASSALATVSKTMAVSAERTSTEASAASEGGSLVSSRMANVATAVEQLNGSIREVAASASEASIVASNAVDVAHKTSMTISKLSESSEEISNVIRVIDSIAQQTNLLALNATIEAARAGEAGRGFAVVAHEVKELSNQTAEATKEISLRMEAIQANTDGAVEANNEIGETIDRINGISATIASAVEEQSTTTADIAHSIEDAAASTQDVAGNVNDLAAAAESTRDATNNAKLAAAQITQTATDLRHLVSRSH